MQAIFYSNIPLDINLIMKNDKMKDSLQREKLLLKIEHSGNSDI